MNSTYIPAIPDEDCEARGHEFGTVEVNDLESATFCKNCSQAWSIAFDLAFDRSTFVTEDGKTEVAIRVADRLLAAWRKDVAPE